MGGLRKESPSTLWSDIAQTRESDEARRRGAWERLAASYWKPVYIHIRSVWSKSNEEAKDLAQDFFAWMMETGLPARADPARGRFRILVKTALRNFLSNEARNRRRSKRGGNRVMVMLDQPHCELEGLELPGRDGSPEETLEQAWKAGLVQRAKQLLEEACCREGKQTYYLLFSDYALEGSPGLTHAEAAAKYSIATGDVNNFLAACRRRFREIVTDLVAETVDGPDELRNELRELFGGGTP